MRTPASRRQRKARARQLLDREKHELIFGDDGAASVFISEADRRAMWQEHAAAIGADLAPGQRAWAWWQLDAPEARNASEPESLQLLRLGVLSDAERVALAETWLAAERRARRQAQASPTARVSPAERERIYQSVRTSLGVPADLPGAADDPLAENEVGIVITPHTERVSMLATTHTHEHEHGSAHDAREARRALIAQRQAEREALEAELPALVAASAAAKVRYETSKAATDALGVAWNEAIAAQRTRINQANSRVGRVDAELVATAPANIADARRWCDAQFQRVRGSRSGEYADVAAVLSALTAVRETLGVWELDECGDDLPQRIDELKAGTGAREITR